MQPLYELSGGVPRRINRLCDLALLVGFADESSAISAEQVEAVAEELTAVVPD
jgi:general secretion pathway protein A